MLNYIAPFTFFFKEKGWLLKLLIASLLTCTIIGAAPVLGWCIEIARRVSRDEHPLVPEWKNWGTFWKLGGKFALVNLPWVLPLLVISLLLFLPLLLVGRLPDETVLLAWVGTFGIAVTLMIVYSFIYMFFIPAMMAALVQDSPARQAMSPALLVRIIRPKVSAYAMVFLIVGLGVTTAAGMLASMTFFLLSPALMVYTFLITAHYAGQLARG